MDRCLPVSKIYCSSYKEGAKGKINSVGQNDRLLLITEVDAIESLLLKFINVLFRLLVIEGRKIDPDHTIMGVV